MTFEPRDPEFEKRTRENFLSQGFMHTLGAAMSGLAPGRPRRDADALAPPNEGVATDPRPLGATGRGVTR